MTRITDDELALLAAGIQFCEVSARNRLNMAQTVDRFLVILKEYYEDGDDDTPDTNILKFERKNNA
jgi:hypothetical protein